MGEGKEASVLCFNKIQYFQKKNGDFKQHKIYANIEKFFILNIFGGEKMVRKLSE